ncbi:SH3 domain-containing protein [Sabulicella glaciei]|uniref:SH3 domain-containing protein n=1 Tax=Sabulicella glaciei TaxID=2984948 RepID=A0ABT3P0U4_9PROT|nr:SH3 domain-containing protein [Roseococcus sp. MDT2-1-1]MCW8087803.1 SH3 domain-containing protein [Roseococcus sp. MDT2-1-1]
MPARPLPPLPTQSAPEAAPTVAGSDRPTAAPPASSAAPPAAAAPSFRTVVTSARSGANLRSAPQGGQVLRVVPRSSTLQVLGEAPGGWYQVGQNGAAWGWIHSSVVERTDR